ncbi:MAG: SdrD B-like domain-containing protein [Burkholderiaceae bacterium]|nr:SdrD B-like domain-containing protein [Burkholderiaceae bacterium]
MSQADLTVTKVSSVGSGSATVGGTISYTVTLVNLGPSTAQNVTITDVLGTGLSLVSSSSNQGTASVAGASVGATTSSLAINQTLTLVVVASVTSSAAGTVTNTANGTSTTPDPTPSNTVTVPVPAVSQADLTVTKVSSVGSGSATVGGTISYTVTLVNLGPSTAQNVTITDVLGTGLTLVSSSSNRATATVVGGSVGATTSSLSLNQTLTLVVVASVTSSATGTVTNTANGTSTTPDPTPSNTVTVPVPVVSQADLTVTKVSSVGSGSATVGSTISYTVTLVNLGPSAAQNVTITDVLGTGLNLVSSSSNRGTVTGVAVNGSIGATTSSLSLNQTLTLVVVASVTSSAAGTVTNTASGTSTTPDPTPSNTVTAAVPVIGQADLTVTKVSSVGSGSATVGSTISYTVTLVNLGPSTALNVTITDVLGTGLNLASSSSNRGTATVVGGSVGATTSSLSLNQTLTLVVVASVTSSAAGTVTNTANGTSTTPDPTPSNTVTVVVPVIGQADLTVTKVASVGSVTTGSTISYTVTLVNLGPSTAYDVTLTDILSGGGLSYISSTSNGSVSTVTGGVQARTSTLTLNQTLTLVVVASVTATTGNITNTVAGTSTTPDPVTGNNTTTLLVPVSTPTDLSVTLSIPGTASAGSTVSGTVTFHNLSTVAADNLTRTLVLGGGTFTAVQSSGVLTSSATATFNTTTMAANSSVSYTFTYVVPTSGAVSATASIATTTTETTTTNNITTSTTVVSTSSSSELSVTLSMPSQGSASGTATGTVTFYNSGSLQANNVTRTLALKSGTITAVASGGTVLAGSVTVTFHVPSMAAGASASYSFTYQLPSTGVTYGTATLISNLSESNLVNNTATSFTSIGSVPDFSVTLRINPSSGITGTQLLALGANTIQMVITNVGSISASGQATLTQPLSPANTNWPTLDVRTFTVPTLSPGSTVGFIVNYTVPSSMTYGQTFTAATTAGASELNLANNNTGQIIVPVGATIKGKSWVDANSNGSFQAGEPVLPNLQVRLYQNTTATLIATGRTDADGNYTIGGLVPGTNFIVLFYDCLNATSSDNCTAIGTTPRNQGTTTEIFGLSNPGVTGGQSSAVGGTIGTQITGISLYAGDNTINQNLPLDPSGFVYDSVTRKPVAGVTVRLNGPAAFNSTFLTSGNQDFVTGANGFYSFFFIGVGAAQAGSYTLSITNVPATHLNRTATLGGVSAPNVIGGVLTTSFIVSAAGPTDIGQSGAGIPAVGVNGSAALGAAGTQYLTTMFFNFGPGFAGEVLHNHIPLDSVVLASGAGAVVTAGDLMITKAGPTTMVGGATGTYSLVVSNLGPTVAQNTTVTDNMPAGMTLLSASVRPAGAFALNVTPTGLSATTSSFGIGVSTITLVVRAEISTVGTTVTNVASVASGLTETDSTNNSASASTRVVGVDLSLTKQGPGSVATGATATYTLVIVNAGPSVAANVTVSDAMPAGLTLASASVMSGSFTLVTTTASLSALASSMPVGTAVIALTVNVGPEVVGSVTNVARVTSTTPDTQPNNNVGTATSGVLGADLALSKFGPATISAAGTATYTLVIVNHGPSVATNVTITDMMPVGLSLLSAGTSPAGSITLGVTPEKLEAVAQLMRIGTVTVNLTVQAAYTATGTVTNIASVTATTPDPTTTNNIGTVSSSVKEVEPGVILVNKTGNKTVAEVADSVQYTIRMRNTINVPVSGIVLEDLLPAGFRYILGTARLNNVTLADPTGGIGRQLGFNIGTIPGGSTFELTYFVRLGVGSQQGDGTNRATAVFPGARGVPVRSNTALFKVQVQGGVFSNEGCIVGKVYMDCDGNSAQSNESGSRELGIPGVRLVMLDGTYVVTDNEGKYSICGVRPQTHVIKVDRTTLPRGSRMLPSSNRNAGVGDSLFVEMRGGELARADFIEGSCSPEVLDQVKARRSEGGVTLPANEKGQPLTIENRPADGAPQILPAPRGGVFAPGGRN